MPQWTETNHTITFSACDQPSTIQRGFFQGTKIFTCINISDMSLNSQSLPKYLYPDIVQEQEFCYISCSYMCSLWTPFNKYTSNSEERVWNIEVIISMFQRHFCRQYKRRCVSCRWQYLITLSRWESNSPSFCSWCWSGGTGAKQADPFMILESQNGISRAVSY